MNTLSHSCIFAFFLLAIAYFYGEYLESQEPAKVAYVTRNLQYSNHYYGHTYFIEGIDCYWKQSAGKVKIFEYQNFYVVRDNKNYAPKMFNVPVWRENWRRCRLKDGKVTLF